MFDTFIGRRKKKLADPFVDSKILDLTFDTVEGVKNAGSYKPVIGMPQGLTITANAVANHDACRLSPTCHLIIPYDAVISPQVTNYTREAWVIRRANIQAALWAQDRYYVNFDNCLFFYTDGSIRDMTAGTGSIANWNIGAVEMANNVDDLIHVVIQKEFNTFRHWYNGVEQMPTRSMVASNNANSLIIGGTSWNNPTNFIQADLLRLRFTNDLRYSGNFEVPSLDV